MDIDRVIKELEKQLADLKEEFEMKTASLSSKLETLNEARDLLESMEGSMDSEPILTLEHGEASSPKDLTQKMVALECGEKLERDYTRDDVKAYADANYPTLFGEVLPKSWANTLSKLAQQKKLIRVKIGKDGESSIYRLPTAASTNH